MFERFFAKYRIVPAGVRLMSNYQNEPVAMKYYKVQRRYGLKWIDQNIDFGSMGHTLDRATEFVNQRIKNDEENARQKAEGIRYFG